MNIVGAVNATIDNLFLYLNIPGVSITGTKISQDKVGMFARDYDLFLSILVQNLIEDVNI